MKKRRLTNAFLINFSIVIILYCMVFLNLSNNLYLWTYIITNNKIQKHRFELTSNAPFSNNPIDITMTIGENIKINWFLWDGIGPGKYRIWTNDSNDNYYVWINWTNWMNNTNLQVPINRTILGIFNYTIEYNNSAGIFGIPDTVIVNIIPSQPIYKPPELFFYLIQTIQDEEFRKQIGLIIIGIIGGGLILSLILYFSKKKKVLTQ